MKCSDLFYFLCVELKPQTPAPTVQRSTQRPTTAKHVYIFTWTPGPYTPYTPRQDYQSSEYWPTNYTLYCHRTNQPLCQITRSRVPFKLMVIYQFIYFFNLLFFIRRPIAHTPACTHTEMDRSADLILWNKCIFSIAYIFFKLALYLICSCWLICNNLGSHRGLLYFAHTLVCLKNFRKIFVWLYFKKRSMNIFYAAKWVICDLHSNRLKLEISAWWWCVHISTSARAWLKVVRGFTAYYCLKT